MTDKFVDSETVKVGQLEQLAEKTQVSAGKKHDQRPTSSSVSELETTSQQIHAWL